jgi:hypothetical protein
MWKYLTANKASESEPITASVQDIKTFLLAIMGKYVPS